MQNNKILRNSKVELLRIIAMMGIVLVHYLNGRMGGALSNINDGYNYYLIHFFESLGILSVNIFVIITSYYSTNEYKIKFRKIINLYSLMVLYALVLFIVTIILGEKMFSLKELLLVFVPFIDGRRWFVETYIIFMLIIPFLNKMLSNLNKFSMFTLTVILLLLFSVWPTFLTNAPILDNGYGITNFITLFVVTYYLKKYCIAQKKIILLNIFIVSVIAIFVMSLISSGRSWAYCNLFNIVGSVSIFQLFINSKPMDVKCINVISSTTFGVFLLHSDFNCWDLYYHKIMRCEHYYESNYLILHMILCVIASFFVFSIIEYLRQQLHKKTIKNTLMSQK